MTTFTNLMNTKNNPAFFAMMAANRSAGKSVLLACLHNLMREQVNYPFYLHVSDDKESNALREKYKSLKKNTWLESTDAKDFSDITFMMRVRTPNGNTYNACSFNYVDYAGGLLIGNTSDDRDAQEAYARFKDKRKHADAMIGMIDGKHLEKYLNPASSEDEKEAAFEAIAEDIERIKSFIDHNDNSRTLQAIQFVISKWDLLHALGITLEKVIRTLHKVEGFPQFLQHLQNNPNYTVRIIPVSAVGLHAVTENTLDGSKIAPYNIEALLSCVLADQVLLNYNCKDKEREETALQDTTVKAQYRFRDEVAKGLYAIIDIFGYTADGLLEGRRAAELAASNESQRLEREKQHRLAIIQDELGAFAHVLHSFGEIQRELDRRFPASALNVSLSAAA